MQVLFLPNSINHFLEQEVFFDELLQWINAVSFAVNDVTLFLDTHPDDAEALEYFEEFRTQRTRALQEYSRNYGPLTIDTATATPCERWQWSTQSWPWQEGGC